LFSAKIVDRDSARHRSYVRLRAAMQCVLARDAHQRPSPTAFLAAGAR
jgi:hypothetical protein